MINGMMVFNGVKYAIDLEKVRDFCLQSDKDKTKEIELVNTYTPDEDGSLTQTLKTEREVKSPGNPQNDTITYDLIKLFIMTLLNNTLPTLPDEDEVIEPDYATALAFNTLLALDMIKIIE